MTYIVGIGGKLASGKDAIADYLVEKHGWTKFGMSDALADALYTLDPWIVNIRPTEGKFLFRLWRKWFQKESDFQDIDLIKYSALVDRVGYVEAKTNDEVRRLLQILGTEVGRKQIDDNLWVNLMVKKVRAAADTGVPGVIVTGVRFPNELDAIMEDLEGETWWVSRPSLRGTVNAGHASENSVSEVDFERCIVNDGTLEDLYRKVDALVT